MQNSNLSLSIIIVNYRSEQYLENCLASIYNKINLKENCEIIIVNNDKNESLEKIKNKFLGAKIINNQKNIGFGAANNQGAKEAQGRYLLFLNPDTEILQDGLEEILDKFEENEEIAVIGPRLVTGESKTQLWCAGEEVTWWSLIKNNFGIIESRSIWESKNEIFADWVSGAALFVKKEIFDKIEGFDENFFMYYEDVDLCRRIRKVGYKVLYYPKISILHKGGKSRKNISKQKIQYFKSAFFYIKKWQKPSRKI